MKTFLKIFIGLILLLVLIIGGYVAYVFIDFYRLDDMLELEVQNVSDEAACLDTEYLIVCYNVGFGAYSNDYSFFMDGGKYSRAFSREAVYENLDGAFSVVKKENPDFIYLQEIDVGSTRSYHVDQYVLAMEAFPDYGSVFAQNYDSPYLFYPFIRPHGKSVAGLVTLSSFKIEEAVRRSLPIEDSFMKLVDLDRCYSLIRVPTENGKSLCLYNLHLSAYSSDGSIATRQLEMLFEDMSSEYAAGNYILCGGDFNKDLLGDSSKIFGVSGEEYSWAQSFPFELLPKNFSLIAPLDERNPIPSARNANAAYDPETAFVLTIDGYIVSDNVEVISSAVIDEGFAYSDHNPVKMYFSLKSDM